MQPMILLPYSQTHLLHMTSPLPAYLLSIPSIRPLLPVPCSSLRSCCALLSFTFRLIVWLRFPGSLRLSLFSSGLRIQSRARCSWLSAGVILAPERSVIPQLLPRQQLSTTSSSASAATTAVLSFEGLLHSLSHFQRCMHWADSQQRRRMESDAPGRGPRT